MYPRGLLGDKELPSLISNYLERVDIVRVDLVRVGIWYELTGNPEDYHIKQYKYLSCLNINPVYAIGLDWFIYLDRFIGPDRSKI